MEGIPLHAWSEKVFRCIGECFGQVLEVDDDSVTKRRVDRARVKVLCDVHQAIHGTVTMEVGGVRFQVLIRFEEVSEAISPSFDQLGGCSGSVSLVVVLDRWTEVLGPSFQVSWIRMTGIPLHAWYEKVFRCIGECFGQVLEVDDDFVTQRRVDCARMKVLCHVH